jgi:hypothetical protein
MIKKILLSSLLPLIFLNTLNAADTHIGLTYKETELAKQSAQQNTPDKFIKLNVESIVPVQTLENKDEVYIALTSYSSFSEPKHEEIPKFPSYLDSNALASLKKISIWSGVVPAGEYINFKIAFVDRDNPPLNNDDLIGIVSLKIENKDGKIQYTYKDQVSGNVKTSSSMPVIPFRLKTRNSFYQTKIGVEVKEIVDQKE